MIDNISKRKKDLAPEGGVSDKQDVILGTFDYKMTK